jgi:uncharacterized membrane protein
VNDESTKHDSKVPVPESGAELETPDLIPLAVAIPVTESKTSGRPGQMQASLTIQAAQFSGPLPPPALLEHYNKVHPGAADRIIRMAEEQGAHRREMEKLELKADNAIQTRGPILGFILAMTAVLGGIWLVSKGMAVSGLVSLVAAIGAPVGVFVYGKYQQQKEMELESRSQPAKKPKNKRRRK